MTNADIEALDQSRRVGWAKAYQATERLDDALKDCNIAWGDRDAYRNGLSFVVGMLMQRAKNEPSTMNRMMLNEVRKVCPLLDSALVAQGQDRYRQFSRSKAVQKERK